MPKIISKDGTVIAYDKKGQGPVLIQVLGALNKRGRGKKLSDLLTDSFTVVSYDRRGKGDSTDTLPYSPEKEADDLEAMIDNLGESVNLYGHSSGAILSLLAAEKLGSKVKALALYEAPYNYDPQAQKEFQDYKKELSQLIADGKSGDAVALFVKLVGVSDKQIAAMKNLPMWKGLTAMAYTLAYDTVEILETYPKINTQSIKAKALVMYGTKSLDFMGNTATKLSEAMPNATLHPVEGQDHDVKAAVLAPILIDYFK